MKVTALIGVSLLLCLSAVVISADERSQPREAECEKYAIQCTREFDPVCGDNGNTYANECVLCMENRNRNQHVKVMYKGMCKSP